MTTYRIPASPIPNQYFTTTIDGTTWGITLNTRKGNLYASLSNNDGVVLLNRICLDRTSIGYGFIFYDIDGTSDPTYDLLGTRYIMLWTDEI